MASLIAVLNCPPALARDRVLSDEIHTTRWAYPRYATPAVGAPNRFAKHVAALHLLTEDGFPEVYLLLREHRDHLGRNWVELRIPRRPNGTTAWVRRSALGSFHLTHMHLVINRDRLRAVLYRKGIPIWAAPVGIGKPSTPTPRGKFWVREKFKVAPGAQGLYGPYAFGTADYSVLSEWPGGGVVGLHGTGEPGLVPGRPSHGCVRMHNADITRLYRLMPVGTPILIH